MPMPVGVIADEYTKPAVGGGLPVVGALAWYDASDAASLTVSAGKVSQWNDKTGNGLHFTQATSALQPANTGSQNGLTTLVFNNATADNSLARATAISSITDNFTMFGVYKRAAGTGTDGATFFANGTPSNGYAMASRAYNGYYPGFLLGGINWYGYNMEENETAPWMVQTLRRTSGTWSGAVNGVLSASITPSPGNPSAPSGGSTICNTTHRFSGEIAELIFYNSALNNTDRLLIENYLISKWGLVIQSPTEVASLAGWWDASDVASVTASANKVSQWNDKSGYNKHFSQATGANQPTYVSNAINSLSSIQYASLNFMDSAFSPDLVPVSYMVCLQLNVNSTYRTWLSSVINNGPFIHQIEYSQGYRVYPIATSSGKITLNVPYILYFEYSAAGVYKLKVNGVVQGGTNLRTLVGGQLRMGCHTTGSDPWIGYINELAIYSTILSGTDIGKLSRYMKQKWSSL